jgi:hypothetical protein
MKYSIVNNEKVEAFSGGKGICICCGADTIAKCGLKKINHWAHKSLKHCDNWWENETQWHRDWKNHFPIEWQEIVLFDNQTGEKHIADVKTEGGFVIEFQNSPMNTNELKSREEFYKKLVWIINGEKFEKNFHILGKLPVPNLDKFSDIAFCDSKKGHLGRLYFKYSDDPDWDKTDEVKLLRMYDFSDIEAEVEKYYKGHHLFDWVRPHTVWFESQCDVFIDFGGDVLWKLIRYDKKGLYSVRMIDKQLFIKRAIG